ncbi:hypothetical protein K458DRAFT_396881 [Lentithecium fluviatile CBS 122367]|uniref:Glutathione S-transferase n=1 Tax=Lentithecium fluviatile CBS 122367 TaxID=1168545 RepID=A0A6G1IEQ6_9PLEO|nr:hypothetical protein K458DRAFT_396881 [Lentithecium fluviatile CBS 122367]
MDLSVYLGLQADLNIAGIYHMTRSPVVKQMQLVVGRGTGCCSSTSPLHDGFTRGGGPGTHLEVNPRGLVPSIKFDGEILTESAIVAQFLVDVYPSHLLPATGSVEAGLKRARINFFSGYEREQLVKDFVAVVKKDIEPLLKDANPFFGGSEKITLAEAIVAPFILRIFTFAEHGILPESLLSSLNYLPNFVKWAAEVIKQESVLYVWDAEAQVATAKKRFAKLQAESK